MKDHQIAALVNTLRDIAVEFHGAQQLRERISQAVIAALHSDAAQAPIYQAMATDEDHLENGPKNLWMDVEKKFFGEAALRADFRTRIVYASPVAPSAAAQGEVVPAQRYIVIGYGESDYPEASFANDQDELLDAVLGMIYTKPSDACDDTREEYRRELADEDEWCGKVWRTEFEIGGIVVYDLGYGTAPSTGDLVVES